MPWGREELCPVQGRAENHTAPCSKDVGTLLSRPQRRRRKSYILICAKKKSSAWHNSLWITLTATWSKLLWQIILGTASRKEFSITVLHTLRQSHVKKQHTVIKWKDASWASESNESWKECLSRLLSTYQQPALSSHKTAFPALPGCGDLVCKCVPGALGAAAGRDQGSEPRVSGVAAAERGRVGEWALVGRWGCRHCLCLHWALCALWALSVSLCTAVCSQPRVRAQPGSVGVSMCVCPMGTHVQHHCWMEPGHGAAAASPLLVARFGNL